MPFFSHDGIQFHYREGGSGLPFIFQHGLGGDVSQPFGLFAPSGGVRLLAFDCRAHGQSRPVGDPEKISLATFAEDLSVFLDHLQIERAVVGGISMGAAVALNVGLRFPKRVLGLVLSRPAWLAGPRESNVDLFGKVAQFIRRHGPVRGAEVFQRTIEFTNLRREFPDMARSLLGQFQEPRAAEAVVRLERIPRDRPCRDLQELKAIRVPTLVLANRDDPVHPFEYGEALTATIPGAELREITAKSLSAERHGADVQRFIGEFLGRNHFRR
ncbi:MAG: alpha/beta hydrolase [Verrucomicrobia bacterium]|nr:alpha/beta hydrolase [Verrucomicrobiota bacterium]